MTFDEQDLRERLAAAAAQVSPPRFTAQGLIGRIRRRRARIIGLVLGSLLAAAAIAVVVPVSLSDKSTPPTAAAPAAVPFSPSFTVRVNGRSGTHAQGRRIPKFTVTPGEHLRISVGVTVPAHARVATLTPTVTALWLGLSRGVLGTPGDMHPILARTRKPLPPGPHTFSLRWTVPTGLRRGTARYLVANWQTKQASVAQIIAELASPRT